MSENKSNKRPRLDDGASLCILDLPDVLIKACLSFVGPGHYLHIAGTCQKFQEQYSFPKETTWESAASSVSCAKLCLNDNLETGRREYI